MREGLKMNRADYVNFLFEMFASRLITMDEIKMYLNKYDLTGRMYRREDFIKAIINQPGDIIHPFSFGAK